VTAEAERKVAETERNQAEKDRDLAEQHFREAQLRMQAERDEREERLRREEQARLVYVWFSDESGTPEFMVSNSSDIPINHLTIYANLDAEVDDLDSADGTAVENYPGTLFWPVVPPTGRNFLRLSMADVYAPGEDFVPLFHQIPGMHEFLGAEINRFEFTDAAGVTWTRDVEGTLTEGGVHGR